MFTSIGAPEILVILVIILVLFGADKLPKIAHNFGKGMNEFKKASDNLKNEFEKGKFEINDTYESTFGDPFSYDEEDSNNGDGLSKKDDKQKNENKQRNSN